MFEAKASIPPTPSGMGREAAERQPLLFSPAPAGPRGALVIKTEEKGSDVNLASHLLLDTFRKDCDAAFVVSNDSDLVTPIEIVRQRFGNDVGLLNPYPRASRRLLQVVSFNRRIREPALRACQFPPAMQDKHGVITKPAIW